MRPRGMLEIGIYSDEDSSDEFQNPSSSNYHLHCSLFEYGFRVWTTINRRKWLKLVTGCKSELFEVGWGLVLDFEIERGARRYDCDSRSDGEVTRRQEVKGEPCQQDHLIGRIAISQIRTSLKVGRQDTAPRRHVLLV